MGKYAQDKKDFPLQSHQRQEGFSSPISSETRRIFLSDLIRDKDKKDFPVRSHQRQEGFSCPISSEIRRIFLSDLIRDKTKGKKSTPKDTAARSVARNGNTHIGDEGCDYKISLVASTTGIQTREAKDHAVRNSLRFLL
ncbi:hypothetical protein RRG08_012705 [Elysia crispata]|uniref:Uncharacterized protein n=1 Tax=Elysia crispata TaxID=231223 RepID=A0AAE1AD34_9GAST|nr:hypothetical protein RRG08_012705 [Elysia crispata]